PPGAGRRRRRRGGAARRGTAVPRSAWPARHRYGPRPCGRWSSRSGSALPACRQAAAGPSAPGPAGRRHPRPPPVPSRSHRAAGQQAQREHLGGSEHDGTAGAHEPSLLPPGTPGLIGGHAASFRRSALSGIPWSRRPGTEAGDMPVQIGTFVALGDSFTEGLDDPRADQAGYLGWADRFAQLLAAEQPGLRYAHLAVRGQLLGPGAAEPGPQAIAMAPGLVRLGAGGNDLLRFRSDPDVLAQTFDDTVRTLLMTGCQVLIFTGFDPRFPVLRLIRGKVAAYNMHLRAIADQHGCHVV